MQWAIFGIKNVCQENRENQQYIQQMQQQGLAKNDYMTDTNIHCRMENGRIKMVNSSNSKDTDR